MYNCLMGFKSSSICGCILADFMGLGKTLQTITLIYSLLKMKKIQKCIVISPLTLVSVW
jgi:DNA repair and recombination RAD54-like protein